MLSSSTRRSDRSTLPVEAAQDTDLARLATNVSLWMFIVCAAGRAITFLRREPNEQWMWLDAMLIVLGAATTLIGQTRRLPLQNVLAAAGICALTGGLVQYVGANTGVPFGVFTYTEHAAWIPWLMPLVWVVLILNGRGVSRLIFRPWRKTRLYGLRVIGLTCVLALAFALGMQPYASKVNGYWLWQANQTRWSWFGTPWICFFAWVLTALLILAFCTPFLINKKPGKSPPFYHPLFVWLTVNLVFASGLSEGRMRNGIMAVLAMSALVFSASMAGARWSKLHPRKA
jgi:uncharacterized membrane protein